jgi:hypothetical protein
VKRTVLEASAGLTKPDTCSHHGPNRGLRHWSQHSETVSATVAEAILSESSQIALLPRRFIPCVAPLGSFLRSSKSLGDAGEHTVHSLQLR